MSVTIEDKNVFGEDLTLEMEIVHNDDIRLVQEHDLILICDTGQMMALHAMLEQAIALRQEEGLN